MQSNCSGEKVHLLRVDSVHIFWLCNICWHLEEKIAVSFWTNLDTYNFWKMGTDKENMDNLNQKQAMAQINKYIWMVMPLAMSGNENI